MKVIVEDKCQNCQGTGYVESLRSGLSSCVVCHGRKVANRAISLEDFAKLFTWTKVYDDDAMRGRTAPDYAIVVRTPNGSEDSKESNK